MPGVPPASLTPEKAHYYKKINLDVGAQGYVVGDPKLDAGCVGLFPRPTIVKQKGANVYVRLISVHIK